MIEVKHLTKRYGSHTAVDDLSFVIEKGKIYGFLGPNGAGKSTTMNIITGYLGASEGEVLVGGHSIMDEPIEAKKLIGYLPEIPPLYMDMTVGEYLCFVAKAKGIALSELRKSVAGVMAQTGIRDINARLIRNLSKGYRQRVGIAQALLGNPEVIILDEPTVGLDPAQIIEIRELIRELGKDHTIVLSSHILSEVQAVCDAIMIISRGRLVASDTPENLTALFAGTATIKMEVLANENKALAILKSVDVTEGVEISAADERTSHVEITLENTAQDIREKLFRAFAAADCPILEMTRSHASLEDVFLELTQAPDEEEQAKGKGWHRRKTETVKSEPMDPPADQAEGKEETQA